MKRAAVILAISFAAFTGAQSNGQTAQQNPPAAAGQAAAPAARRPPQAKTQQEFDAYNAAAANTDPAAMEKAADDFAAKFPNSEIRILLYQTAMRLYQNANNGEKTEAMGRKVLSFDADNPEALVTVAEVIAERTRDTDIDKDQRYAEGASMAQKATQTINTDVAAFPAGTTQEKIDAYKGFLLSNAYSILGALEFKKENYPAAQEDLQKSIDAFPSNPDPVVVLRLALAIDKQATATVDQDKQQKLYAEALKVARRAVEMTQDNTPIGTPARSERDRLQKLTESAAPAPPQPAPKN
jgi:tetratricopeptide (TPR) repeat protein